jgi:hypothetical protein
MPCNTKLKKGQTIAQRAAELRKRGEQVDKLLAAGRVSATVGKQGGIAFVGIPEDVRDDGRLRISGDHGAWFASGEDGDRQGGAAGRSGCR